MYAVRLIVAAKVPDPIAPMNILLPVVGNNSQIKYNHAYAAEKNNRGIQP